MRKVVEGTGGSGGVTPADLNARYRFSAVHGNPWELATRPDGTAWVSATVDGGGDVAIDQDDGARPVYLLNGPDATTDLNWALLGNLTPLWGNILGSISDNADLVAAFASKVSKAGDTMSGNYIIESDGINRIRILDNGAGIFVEDVTSSAWSHIDSSGVEVVSADGTMESLLLAGGMTFNGTGLEAGAPVLFSAPTGSSFTFNKQVNLPGGGTGNQAATVTEVASKQDAANITQSIPLHSTSETLYPSAKAVYDFAAIAVAGLMEIKGDLDCSANPNYPAALVGDTYYVTVAGRIGGGSGRLVDISDAIVCKADNAGGTEAAVGISWFVLEHNLQGALLAANNLSDLTDAAAARSNLGLGDAAVTTVAAILASAASAAASASKAGSTITGGYAAAGLTLATAKILGRTTAGTGAAEELTAAQVAAFTDAAVRTPITVSGSRALADSDHDRMLLVTGAFTLTLNTGLRADFKCRVMQTSASQCTFADGTATFRNSYSIGANAKTSIQYSVAEINPGPSSTELHLSGDIQA